MSMVGEQMVLRLPTHRRWTLERFVGPVKEDVLANRVSLQWLYGRFSTGKSHLLVGLCRDAEARGVRSIYLDLEMLDDPAVLSSLNEIDVVAIDNVQAVSHLSDWALALYGLINGFSQSAEKSRCYFAARQAASETAFATEDLASRCRAMISHSLTALSDDQKRDVLLNMAEDEGFALPEGAAKYLIERSARELSQLAFVLARVAERSLREKRKVTLPLVRQVLADSV